MRSDRKGFFRRLFQKSPASFDLKPKLMALQIGRTTYGEEFQKARKSFKDTDSTRSRIITTRLMATSKGKW